MQKAKHSAATELGEEPNASRKRRRHDGLDLGLFERDREKRNRTVVNYAEKQNASGGGLRTSDVILACLDVHAHAIKPVLGTALGGELTASSASAASASATDAASTSASASSAAPGAGAAASAPVVTDNASSYYAGLDYLSIALEVHAMQQGRHSAASGSENVPLGAVRHTMSQLLRSGRLRRRLVTPAQMKLTTTTHADEGSGGEQADAGGGTAYALKMIILNTIQVESDEGAPWALAAPEAAGADDSARTHVWKGVTPMTLPQVRGAALVGKRVDVWWAGNGCFFPAYVTGYNARRRGTAYTDGAAGTHVLLYDNGLRAIEHLETAGEPQLWRLLDGGESVLADEEMDPEVVDDRFSGGVTGAVIEEMEVEMEMVESDGDDDTEPPKLVTIRCKGCMPVGSVGTAAHAARKEAVEAAAAAKAATAAEAAAEAEAKAAAEAAEAAEIEAAKGGAESLPPVESLVGRRIEVYWPGDKAWYACDVLDYVAVDGTCFVQ